MPYDIYDRTVSDSSGGVIPGQVASGGGTFGPIHVIRKAIAASDQDTSLFGSAGAPFKFRIIDAFVNVDTANASETLTLRDASGGSGNALSAALSLGSTGRVREATAPATRTVAAAGNVYLRRNTTVGVGDLIVTIQYES